jgi:hypothetical protein
MKMPKRQKRVKLSKAQILENDTNKWLAKKTAAIDMLCKAMEHLKSLDRSHRRLQKAALKPVQKKITRKSKQVDPTTQLGVLGPAPGFDAAGNPVFLEDRDQRMKALGFRKTGKRQSATSV